MYRIDCFLPNISSQYEFHRFSDFNEPILVLLMNFAIILLPHIEKIIIRVTCTIFFINPIDSF